MEINGRGREESMIIPISVIIFTLNEEIHIPSCLKSMEWCDDVIVVDSFSTDRTEEICRNCGVRFYQHRFEYNQGYSEGETILDHWGLLKDPPHYKNP